jgi:antirestriction protein ArdC
MIAELTNQSTWRFAMRPNEIVTNKILEVMERGEIPWKKPWQALRPMSVEGRPYQGINRILLSFEPYGDHRYLTYKKALALGGNVKKGQHGHTVVFWRIDRVQDDKTEETRTIPFMRLYTVFNVEQCEGLDIKPIEVHQFNPIEAAQGIMEGWHGMPRLQHKEPAAFYSPMLDYINMPKPETFYTDEGYYATLFHEMVHATGHESRLHRFETNQYSHEAYSKEELVAEIGSAFLCAQAGIEVPEITENHAGYLQSWIRAIKGNHNLVITAASKAEHAYNMIVGKAEEMEAAA